MSNENNKLKQPIEDYFKNNPEEFERLKKSIEETMNRDFSVEHGLKILEVNNYFNTWFKNNVK